MTQRKEIKMNRAETAAALHEKTAAADRASNFLQGMIREFNNANDIALKTMKEMTLATRVGRGRHEQDSD